MRRITAATLVLTLVTIAAVAIAQGPPERGQGPRGAAPAGARGGGGIFPRVPSLPFPAAPQTIETIHQKIRVVPHVRLETPWSIAFLPNGDMLVTEKAGRLRVVRNGTLATQPISGTPQVVRWARRPP